MEELSKNHNFPIIIYDINIFDGKYNLIIKKNQLLGKGSYGHVYYIGNIYGISCVIKIIKSKFNNITKNKNKDTDSEKEDEYEENFIFEYESELHFYNKYENSKHNIKSLPKLLNYGTAHNKIDHKFYDYMILEYVGTLNLSNIFNNLVHMDNDEKKIINLIYLCLYEHIISFHNTNMVYRDISSSNIVVSDKVAYFFAKKYYIFSELIPDTMQNVIFKEYIENLLDPKDILEDIENDYKNRKYSNIVRFVDAGMICDLDELEKIEIYNKYNSLLSGSFTDFQHLDSLFSATTRFISPFCMLNLSSLIKKYDKEYFSKNVKYILSMALKLADFWSLNIIFLIHFYDLENPNDKYEIFIRKKTKKDSNSLVISTTEKLILEMPFCSNKNNIFLIKELYNYTKYDNLNNAYYGNLNVIVINSLNNIIDMINSVIFSLKKNNYVYIIEFNNNTNEDYEYQNNLCNKFMKCYDNIINDYKFNKNIM
jgi:hypothetical protein